MKENSETYCSTALGAPIDFSVWIDEPDDIYREIAEIRYSFSPTDIEGNSGFRDPHVRGVYNAETRTLQIENIEKGCIDAGQGFLFRTLNELIKHQPEVKTILLANINHSETLRFLQENKQPGDLLRPTKDTYCGPLVNTLVKIGCPSITVVREGTAYWGLEAKTPITNSAPLTCT